MESTTTQGATLLIAGKFAIVEPLSRELRQRGAQVIETTPSRITGAMQEHAPDAIVIAEQGSTCARILSQLMDNPLGRIAPVVIVGDSPFEGQTAPFRAGAVEVIGASTAPFEMATTVLSVIQKIGARSGRAAGELAGWTKKTLSEMSEGHRHGVLFAGPQGPFVYDGTQRFGTDRFEGAGYDFFEFANVATKHSEAEGIDRVFDQLRVLVLDNDPARGDALASQLRQKGALAAASQFSVEGLERTRRLDPSVLIIDQGTLTPEHGEHFARIHQDPRLRWAGLCVMDIAQTLDVDKLAASVSRLIAAEHLLVSRLASTRDFTFRVEATGPSRFFRCLSRAAGMWGCTVHTPRSSFTFYLSDGTLLSAEAFTPAGRLDSLDAVAAFAQVSAGRIEMKASAPPPHANVMLSVEEAMGQLVFETPTPLDPIALQKPPQHTTYTASQVAASAGRKETSGKETSGRAPQTPVPRRARSRARTLLGQPSSRRPDAYRPPTGPQNIDRSSEFEDSSESTEVVREAELKRRARSSGMDIETLGIESDDSGSVELNGSDFEELKKTTPPNNASKGASKQAPSTGKSSETANKKKGTSPPAVPRPLPVSPVATTKAKRDAPSPPRIPKAPSEPSLSSFQSLKPGDFSLESLPPGQGSADKASPPPLDDSPGLSFPTDTAAPAEGGSLPIDLSALEDLEATTESPAPNMPELAGLDEALGVKSPAQSDTTVDDEVPDADRPVEERAVASEQESGPTEKFDMRDVSFDAVSRPASSGATSSETLNDKPNMFGGRDEVTEQIPREINRSTSGAWKWIAGLLVVACLVTAALVTLDLVPMPGATDSDRSRESGGGTSTEARETETAQVAATEVGETATETEVAETETSETETVGETGVAETEVAETSETAEAPDSEATQSEADAQSDASDEDFSNLTRRQRGRLSDDTADEALDALREENVALGMQLAERAVRIDDSNPQAIAALARAHVEAGNGAEAVEWAERAVQRRVRRSAYRVLLGDAHRVAGNEAEARRSYREAVSIDDNLMARRRLAE